MSRIVSLLVAVACYAIFFATFLYLICFVGDLSFAPLTVDRGGIEGPIALALIVNVALIAIFGLQHSVMARQGFKRAWTRIVPAHLERSAFVLAASVALIVLFLFWRPMPGVVWEIGNPLLANLMWALFWIGWATVLVSTFLINHFELFGLQQAWFNARGREAAPPTLRQPMLYKWVAHPLYAGFFLAFWATPQMTVGHLLLAVGMSVYMLIAIRYEERDLVGLFGDDYVKYRSSVGMLLPRFRKRSA